MSRVDPVFLSSIFNHGKEIVDIFISNRYKNAIENYLWGLKTQHGTEGR